MKNRKVIVALIVIMIFMLVIIFLNFRNSSVIIFAYHKIVPTDIKEKYYSENKWVDTKERFEKQMKYLYDHNYKTISMNEYEEWRMSHKKISKKTVMITFDDGDIELYYEVLPILKKYNFKATCFLIGEQIEDTSEEYNPNKQQFLGMDLINKIKDEYPQLEFQSHSYNLHKNDENGNPIFFSYNKDDIDKDFEKMKKYNTSIFCYPYGSLNDNIKESLKDNNYRMAFLLDNSKISKKNDDKYSIPRVGINYETSFKTFKKWLFKQMLL